MKDKKKKTTIWNCKPEKKQAIKQLVHIGLRLFRQLHSQF